MSLLGNGTESMPIPQFLCRDVRLRRLRAEPRVAGEKVGLSDLARGVKSRLSCASCLPSPVAEVCGELVTIVEAVRGEILACHAMLCFDGSCFRLRLAPNLPPAPPTTVIARSSAFALFRLPLHLFRVHILERHPIIHSQSFIVFVALFLLRSSASRLRSALPRLRNGGIITARGQRFSCWRTVRTLDVSRLKSKDHDIVAKAVVPVSQTGSPRPAHHLL